MVSMQVLHRSPDVFFGLFSLNWQLLFSVSNQFSCAMHDGAYFCILNFLIRLQYVASVASYLFILIQFVMYVDEKSAVLMQNQQIFNDFNINITLSTYPEATTGNHVSLQ